jgi:hypothetical protein
VSAASQYDAILAHLRAGNTITGLEALSRFGCARLAARIYDIREDGHQVKSSRVTTSSGKKVSMYYL